MRTLSHDQRAALFDPRDIASRGLITTGFHLPYDQADQTRSRPAQEHDRGGEEAIVRLPTEFSAPRFATAPD